MELFEENDKKSRHKAVSDKTYRFVRLVDVDTVDFEENGDDIGFVVVGCRRQRSVLDALQKEQQR